MRVSFEILIFLLILGMCLFQAEDSYVEDNAYGVIFN